MDLPNISLWSCPLWLSSATGMLTAQTKLVLILWIIFLCWLKKKKSKKKGRRVKNLRHKETVSASLENRLVWKVLWAQGHVSVQMLNKKQTNRWLVSWMFIRFIALHWPRFKRAAAESRVCVVLLPRRCLESARLGHRFQPGSSKMGVGVGGLFSVFSEPNRYCLFIHNTFAQAARASDLFPFGWNDINPGWFCLPFPNN